MALLDYRLWEVRRTSVWLAARPPALHELASLREGMREWLRPQQKHGQAVGMGGWGLGRVARGRLVTRGPNQEAPKCDMCASLPFLVVHVRGRRWRGEGTSHGQGFSPLGTAWLSAAARSWMYLAGAAPDRRDACCCWWWRLGVCTCVCESMCVHLKYNKKEACHTQLQEAGRALSMPVPSELAQWGSGGGRGEEPSAEGRWMLAMDKRRGWVPPGASGHTGQTHKQSPQQIAGSLSQEGCRHWAKEPQRTQLGAGGRRRTGNRHVGSWAGGRGSNWALVVWPGGFWGCALGALGP